MKEETGVLTFPSLFNETVRQHGNSMAYAFAGEEPISYSSAAIRIKALSALLEKTGILQGDRVAILSTNMPNWPLAYFAITFMGAVAVPVLPDFSTAEVYNVLEHSEAKALFVSSGLIYKIEESKPDTLRTVIQIENFSVIRTDNGPVEFLEGAGTTGNYLVDEEDLASIIYTSGTTGRPKGVMLTHKNICFNATGGRMIQDVNENDRFLSVLPLSHTYENTLGLILPMLGGACVYYLKKPPTPAVLLPALELVRPTMMLTVPLIIEKVYFNKILPAIQEKPLIKFLYKIPPLRKIFNLAAGRKLMNTFGGQLKFFGIGGSKLNSTVEKFLREAKFPYAVGYGLTETAPLLAGASPLETVFKSTGPAIKNIELIINNPDIKTGEGEIWTRGPNLMRGYYKDPGMTSAAITKDGWFKTGDLGIIDSHNNLFIRGRLKNMIIGSSGENIYPEDIESVINNFSFVLESLVVQQKGKLVALVHLNMEEMEKKYQYLKGMAEKYDDKIQDFLDELREYVNSRVNKFSRINKIILQPVPFQKTATLKIKRFLYT
jgi:long-chain acyl-CoA synthetase